ncbi:hypothetical protein DFJ73DRAFT_824177 [Zopfochytrium polystomum]|nr:hypothetical protein DFJ73DRAFT_824177 [Zopfochytrium polystomum]
MPARNLCLHLGLSVGSAVGKNASKEAHVFQRLIEGKQTSKQSERTCQLPLPMRVVSAPAAVPFDDQNAIAWCIVVADSSAFAWVGAVDPASSADSLAAPSGRLDNLALAIPTPYDRAALTTSLLSKDFTDDSYVAMSRRLATKFAMPVYVSCDIPSANSDLLLFAERQLMLALKDALKEGN